jgi:hypothetical protein
MRDLRIGNARAHETLAGAMPEVLAGIADGPEQPPRSRTEQSQGRPMKTWESLTAEERQAILNGMPRGLDGYLVHWGWDTFAVAVERMCQEKNGPQAPEKILAERDALRRKLQRLLSLLDDRSDADYDYDAGRFVGNEANSILAEYQGWLDGWIK